MQVSIEEFGQLQNQVLALKHQCYTLQDKEKRYIAEQQKAKDDMARLENELKTLREESAKSRKLSHQASNLGEENHGLREQLQHLRLALVAMQEEKEKAVNTAHDEHREQENALRTSLRMKQQEVESLQKSLGSSQSTGDRGSIAVLSDAYPTAIQILSLSGEERKPFLWDKMQNFFDREGIATDEPLLQGLVEELLTYFPPCSVVKLPGDPDTKPLEPVLSSPQRSSSNLLDASSSSPTAAAYSETPLPTVEPLPVTEENLRKVEAELIAARADTDRLVRKIRAQEKDLQSLRERSDQQNGELARLTKMRKDTSTENEAIKNKFAALQEALDNVSKDKFELDSKIGALSRQRDQLVLELLALQSQYKVASEEAKQKFELACRQQELEKDLKDREATIQNLENQLERKQQTVESTAEEAAREIADLKESINKKQEEIDQLRTQVNQLESSQSSLQDELNQSKSEAESIREQLQLKENEVSALNSQLTRKQQTCNELETEKEDLKVEIQILRKRSAHEAKDLRLQLSKEKTSFERLEQEKKRLEDELTKSTDALNQALVSAQNVQADSQPVNLEVRVQQELRKQIQKEAKQDRIIVEALSQRIQDLEAETYRAKERMKFLEENIQLLTDDNSRKKEIIQGLVRHTTAVIEPQGIDKADQELLLRRKSSIMRMDKESIESLLESTLLENVRMRNDVASLGAELNQLMRQSLVQEQKLNQAQALLNPPPPPPSPPVLSQPTANHPAGDSTDTTDAQ